jgi:hypothetical protein
MSEKYRQIPTLDDFHRLEFLIVRYMNQIPSFETSDISEDLINSLTSHFKNIVAYRDDVTKTKLSKVLAYQWLSDDSKSFFNLGLGFVIKDRTKDNYVNLASLEIEGLIEFLNDNPKPTDPNGKKEFDEDFINLVEEAALNYGRYVFERELLIKFISRCLKDISYDPDDSNKNYQIATENTIMHDVKKVIQALESARAGCKNLTKYRLIAETGEKASELIQEALNILEKNQLPYSIKRNKGELKFKEFVIKMTRYFIKDGGVSIGKTSSRTVPKKGDDTNILETPVAVYLFENEICSIELKSQQDFLNKTQDHNFDFLDQRNLAYWKLEDEPEFYSITRTNCKHTINDVANCIENIAVFIFPRLLANDKNDIEINITGIKAIVKHEILKHALEIEIDNRLNKAKSRLAKKYYLTII